MPRSSRCTTAETSSIDATPSKVPAMSRKLGSASKKDMKHRRISAPSSQTARASPFLKKSKVVQEARENAGGTSLCKFLFAVFLESLAVVSPGLESWRWVLVATAVGVIFGTLHPLIGASYTCVVLFLLAEGCFFVWGEITRSDMRPIKPKSERIAPPTSAETLIQRVIACVEECHSWMGEQPGVGRTPESWLEGWFLGTPLAMIRRGNLREFIAWAVHTSLPEELDHVECKEVDDTLDLFMSRFGWDFAEGYNESVKAIRINFDDMYSWRHPLVYYGGIAAMRVVTHQAMRLMGFQYYAEPKGISYFHYAGTSGPRGENSQAADVDEASAPLVLIHGLGVGIFPYLHMIWHMIYTGRECFVVELPEVAQTGCRTVLSPEGAADEFTNMLREHGHDRACFVAHSYGTFVLSWVVRARKDLVAKAVFLDPVCFHLAQPDVAFNFIYRKPTGPFTALMTCFVRWEVFSANVLMRHFYWQHNVLWKEELPENWAMALSGADSIVNSPFVQQYLAEKKSQGAGQDGQQATEQQVYFEGYMHGQLLFSRDALKKVMQLI